MGIVEEFNPQRIVGWVECHDQDDDRNVQIMLNGIEVARTIACRMEPFAGESRPFGFSRRMRDLFNYIGPKDEITVEHKGRSLPIVGSGFTFVPQTQGKFSSSMLFNKIEKGFVFTSYGRLTRPLNKRFALQAAFIRQLSRLQPLVLEKFGLQLFITYGTLLGCVRDGDFIAHDKDFDLTYISTETSPDRVKAENLHLCKFLIEQGCEGTILKSAFAVKTPVPFDLYYSWFSEEGEFQTSFGYHGARAKRNDGFFTFEARQLGRFTVRVPVAAEAILAQLYGEGWRVPDPGFEHARATRKKDRAYVHDDEQVRKLYWYQFYSHHQLSGGSSFADFVLQQMPAPDLLLDVGCGTGRDTIHFAQRGIPSIGIDASQAAIDKARSQMEAAGVNCRFDLIDVGCGGDVDRVLSTLPPTEELIIYMRFFLHAVPEALEDVLLSALVRGVGSFTLAAEFRTNQDRDLPKHSLPHYRRYINPDKFQAKLENRYGLHIRHREEGFGLSVFQQEDPHLCRIIAVKE